MNANHMIGLNLNADDEMPTDLTITTAIPYYFYQKDYEYESEEMKG